MMTNQNLKMVQNTLQNAITGSVEFNEALDLLNSTEMKKNIDAQLYLSWIYLQRGAIKDATQKAFKICQNIANQTGHPIALERMADILLWGVGIEKNRQHSFQIYRRLANQGMLPFTTLAYFYSHGIGTSADERIATNYILKSAAQGETLAFMLLAYRFEKGIGLPIDGVLAQAYAHLAVKRGFPGAQQKLNQLKIRFAATDSDKVEKVVNSLIANIEALSDKVDDLTQSMPPNHPDFLKAYTQLLMTNLESLDIKALFFDPEYRGYAIQSREFNLPEIEVISDSPRLQIIEDFADFEECQYLIEQSLPIMESTALQMKRKTNTEVDAFSGESAILSSGKTSPVARIIQERFAHFIKVPVSHFEPISILKYSEGHDYSLHTDAFDEHRILQHESKNDFGGQRMTTNLIYLLPPLEGGQTHYQAIDYTVIGKVGTAVIHYNATNDFKADPRSYHTGKTIIKGEKWLLRTATRQNSLFGR